MATVPAHLIGRIDITGRPTSQSLHLRSRQPCGENFNNTCFKLSCIATPELSSSQMRFTADMDEPTHVIDPDGEVIIVLKDANPPFAVWPEEEVEGEKR